MLRVRCAAKVNLCLTILNRRPDGYHNLRSLMTAVSVWDELHLTPSPHFRLIDEHGHPLDKSNTVWRAATIFAEVTGKPLHWTVQLIKGIPSEAGLGGGSSDGAAMLLTLRRLWKIRSRWEKLVPLAVHIGADVPFFLVPTGAAIVEGIGELLKPVKLPKLWLVLAKPKEAMSTKEAFAIWDACPVTVNVDPYSLVEALFSDDWAKVRKHTQNSFELLISRRVPSVTKLKQQLLQAGAKAAVMSGSGTTVVGVFSDKVSASQGLRKVQSQVAWAKLARTLHRSIVIERGERL